MWKNIHLDACLDHINAQRGKSAANPPVGRPAITISRMCGSGGRTVASRLADYLQTHASFERPWTIFDRDLIKKVLEDHLLPPRFAEFLPETCKSRLTELIETLRDHRPPASAIVEQTVETIWKLAEGGYVILVGRAANVITARLRNVFHVRLISPLEGRLERVEEVYDLDRRNALDYLKSQDIARRLYLKEYFGHDIEDPLIYHLVVNTNHFSYDEAAKLIGDAVIRWFNPPRETQSK